MAAVRQPPPSELETHHCGAAQDHLSNPAAHNDIGPLLLDRRLDEQPHRGADRVGNIPTWRVVPSYGPVRADAEDGPVNDAVNGLVVRPWARSISIALVRCLHGLRSRPNYGFRLGVLEHLVLREVVDLD